MDQIPTPITQVTKQSGATPLAHRPMEGIFRESSIYTRKSKGPERP